MLAKSAEKPIHPGDPVGSPRGRRRHPSAPTDGGTTPDSGAFQISVIMPTVDWGGCFEPCARAVIRLVAAEPVGAAEFVVVFDGPECPVPAWVAESDVRTIFTGATRGPARARNCGADVAGGEILFFVDSDVELAPDALDRVRAALEGDPDLAGVFGTYDDTPACNGVVSQFRNLLHHHTHVTHPGRAGSFWSGCGVIRRRVFDDVGGFDPEYRRPSVEDIELGMRVMEDGGRIDLDPSLRCRHHKSWTLRSMIHTDVVHRAVPWTRLILEKGTLPSTLNLDLTNRICGAAAVLSALLAPVPIVAGGWPRYAALAAIAALLATIAWLHRDFYRLCHRRGGAGFAIRSFALHWLFFLYSSLTFAAMVICTIPLKALGRLHWSRRPVASPLLDTDAATIGETLEPLRPTSITT